MSKKKFSKTAENLYGIYVHLRPSNLFVVLQTIVNDSTQVSTIVINSYRNLLVSSIWFECLIS